MAEGSVPTLQPEPADDVFAERRILASVAAALVYAGLNLYLCYLAVHTLPDLSGVPRGYAYAGPVMKILITAAHSGWVVGVVLPALTWLIGIRILWARSGRLWAVGLSTLLTVLAFLGSLYLAGALWDS